jgi:imidazolonepropionase-like amidohydrolase
MFTRCSKRITALSVLLGIGLMTPAVPAEDSSLITIVWAGTILIAPGRPLLRNQSIIIRHGLIERIAAGKLDISAVGVAPEHARVVDLSNLFVLAGLFDLHVHLTTEPEPGGSLDDVTLTSADLALRGAANADRTVRAGFTTVVDMGTGRRAHELAVYAVRDAVAAGRLPGPRILAVGSPISSPGNSRTSRFQPDVEKVVGPQAVCSGPEDCRRAVREQVQRGADVINFYNTGSLLAANAPAQTFSQEEMRTIIDTAHSLSRKVVADGAGRPSSADGVNAAIRAGADWIDTVIYPGKDTWALLAKSGHPYAPHLYAIVAAVGDDESHLAQGSMGWLPVPILTELLALKRAVPAAVGARRAGVRMVFASDAGVFAHGRNAGEFEQLRKAGLSASEAIATATVNAADVLGLSGDSGTVEAGKRADLIGVAADPLADVGALNDVRAVFAGGNLVKLEPTAGPQP